MSDVQGVAVMTWRPARMSHFSPLLKLPPGRMPHSFPTMDAAVASFLASFPGNKHHFLSTLFPEDIRPVSIHDGLYDVVEAALQRGFNVKYTPTTEYVLKCRNAPLPTNPLLVPLSPPIAPQLPQPQPQTLTVNPVREGAAICSVPVSLFGLAKSLVFSMVAQGMGEGAKAELADKRAAGDYECVRGLLTQAMLVGLPVLVATGRDNMDAVQAKFWYAKKLFEAGSVLVLHDTSGAVLAVCVPMGDMTLVREGDTGVLPSELRSAVWSKSCVEMFVRVVCVPPSMQWYDNKDPDFRWDLKKSNCNITSVLPCNTFMGDLFNKYKDLATLRRLLGDYKGKMKALQGVPDASEAMRGPPKGRQPLCDERRRQRMASYEAELETHPSMWT